MKKNKILPYSKQTIEKDDITSVIKVLKSDYLTKGKKTIEFENRCKKFVKSKYAISNINASSSLILCCKAINLSKKDIVWTTVNTYVASINCALHCGSQIDLVDINNYDFNIDIDKLEKKLIISKKKNKIPKLLIVVHMAGYPCDMKKIKLLANKYKFKVVEDASHAFGATYDGSKIGNCKYSDMTVFSFHPVKVITSAEGGLITTNNKNLYKKIISLRENGKIIKKNHPLSNKDPNFYDIEDLGYNFRINEINAALGISQINKTNRFIKEKNKIASYYYKNLNKEKFILPKYLKNRKCSWHLFIIKFRLNLKNDLKKKQFFILKKKEYLLIHTIFH